MLTLNAITVRLGGHVVLDRASATIPARSRVGIVGRNGAGKSTLLKIISGVTDADGGSVETPRDTRIGYVAQGAQAGDVRRRSRRCWRPTPGRCWAAPAITTSCPPWAGWKSAGPGTPAACSARR